jgi:hypothetical protein
MYGFTDRRKLTISLTPLLQMARISLALFVESCSGLAPLWSKKENLDDKVRESYDFVARSFVEFDKFTNGKALLQLRCFIRRSLDR